MALNCFCLVIAVHSCYCLLIPMRLNDEPHDRQTERALFIVVVLRHAAQADPGGRAV